MGTRASGSVESHIYSSNSGQAVQVGIDHSEVANSVPGHLSAGWIILPQLQSQDSGESLLFWVPVHHRRYVCCLRTVAIMATQRTLFDFSRFAHGPAWSECCPSGRTHPIASRCVLTPTLSVTGQSFAGDDPLTPAHSTIALYTPTQFHSTDGELGRKTVPGLIWQFIRFLCCCRCCLIRIASTETHSWCSSWCLKKLNTLIGR